MKNLHQFVKFDLDAFLHGKELTVAACMPWIDYDTKAKVGTRVEAAITRDDTQYVLGKDGGVTSNLYEKVTIKVKKDISVPVGAVIAIAGGAGTIYGDYRNQLSIKAEDVKIVDAAVHKGGRD